jgi:two-component system phosphate regulon sensor histidine kinase PhoR
MLQLANLRSEAQVAPSPSVIDLAEIVRTLVARVEAAAALRQIHIETELESVKVHSVEDYLKMLVDNLLSNAVNYSRDGACVRVACRRGEEDAAVLVVQDEGIGIPAEKLPLVFQDYYRTTEASQHNKASTGLGLAIVRHVAQALKLSVTVESALDWGTQFTVQMPALRDDSVSQLASNRSSRCPTF